MKAAKGLVWATRRAFAACVRRANSLIKNSRKTSFAPSARQSLAAVLICMAWSGAFSQPFNLKATVVSASRIDLDWQNSGCDSFARVFRNGQIIQPWTQGTSFSDTGLQSGTTYTYQLNGGDSCDDNLNQGWSNTVTRTTLSPPSAPTGLGANATGVQISLSWNDTSNNETGFRIQRRLEGGTFSLLADVGANAESYNDSGLAAGTKYYYRVRALGGPAGDSAYTGAVSATTDTVPSAPSGLGVSVNGLQVNLSWTDNSNNETSFRVQRKTGAAGTYANIATLGANITAYSDPGLAAGTQYFYRVRAVGAAGNSPFSNEVSATTDTVPTAPSGLGATAAGLQVNLVWTDNSNNESGFRVQRKTGAGGTYANIATVGANITSYNDPELSSGTQYFYRVQSLGAVGDSAFSNEASATPSGNTAQIYFLHTDHLNTPRLITNNVGQAVWSWNNDDPFGANVPNENPSALGDFTCNLRLPGQYFDKETNLQYNYFRDYDGAIGRYVQSDPIGLRGGSLSPYTYVNNNPLGAIDPLGLVNWKGTFGGMAFIKGAGSAFFRFDLTSECKCNKRIRIQGYVPTVAVGIGAKYTGTGASAEFYDHRECPDPGIANGGAAVVSAGAVFGGGVSCSKMTIGHLYSTFSCGGPTYGFDFSTGYYVGASVVTDVKEENCCGK